jgi:hypothetical protein
LIEAKFRNYHYLAFLVPEGNMYPDSKMQERDSKEAYELHQEEQTSKQGGDASQLCQNAKKSTTRNSNCYKQLTQDNIQEGDQ